MKKINRELVAHLKTHGISLKDNIATTEGAINSEKYQICISHIPRGKNIQRDVEVIRNKLKSKELNINELINELTNKYKKIDIHELINILLTHDSPDKKFNNISKYVKQDTDKLCITKEFEEIENIRDYPDVFPLARTKKRRVVAHLGHTNSGKTYNAVKELLSSSYGSYLAPLRLLALENYEFIKDNGFTVSLITGEERIIEEDSQFVSSTVECFNFNKEYETIIIDEIQMIDDPDRGWAFIQALVGANASNIIVTGPPEYESRLRAISEALGDEFEVKHYSKKTTVEVDKNPMKLCDVEKHTAIVAFSRKDIYRIKNELPPHITASVIYGALGSDVRKQQAKRYIDGVSDVLITTDAIGMGLNLPIKKIMFTTHIKYNGKTNTELGEMLTKQIAGRAGRYGFFDVGYIGALSRDTLSYVKGCLSSDVPVPEHKLAVQPTDDYIRLLLKRYRLSTILSDWSTNTRFPEGSMFVNANIESKILLARYLESHYLNKISDYYRLINCPLDVDKELVFFKNFSKQLIEDHTIVVPHADPKNMSNADLETKVKELIICLWFINQFPDNIPDWVKSVADTKSVLESVNVELNRRLSK